MKKLLLVLLCSVSFAAQVDYYVDSDGSGSNTSPYDTWEKATSTLNTIAALNVDLDTANNNAVIHVRGAAADTTKVDFAGWTTSAADNITITQEDFPADGIGVFDGSIYYLHNNDSTTRMLDITDNYIHIDQLQIQVTATSTNNRAGIYIVTVETSTHNIGNVIFKGVCSGTGTVNAIVVNDGDATLNMYNCTAYGFVSGSETSLIAYYAANCTAANFYNCVAYNNWDGFSRAAGTVTAINCLSFNNDDDFAGVITTSYCAATADEGGTGDFAITQTADDWAALVTDAAGGDFSVTNDSSELYNTGNGATPKSIFTDDIIGTTRGPADADWDVGAFELIESGTILPIIQSQYRRRR